MKAVKIDQGDAYFDALETRDPAQRERDLFARLPDHVAFAKANAPYFAEIFADIEPARIRDRTALASLPVTRKSDLVARQRASLPFGGLNTTAPSALSRIFCSPGPIYDLEGARPDYWRFARALHAAGFRAGDILHNSFSYHLTPAGAMFESAARALGCAVIPAGVGNTEQQLQIIADVQPNGYAGTPSFLKILLEKNREAGHDVSSLTKALVSGEALPPSLRAEIAGYGVDVLQCYGTADVGLIAYETPAKDGMVVAEDVIVEIVAPGTGDPVDDGEAGELLVTTFAPDYPLIRFATGDLSAVLAGTSACGRTNMRIKGWLGRADQVTKVKGMFVHPHQVAAVLARHPEIGRGRLVVDRVEGADVMTLYCESANQRPDLSAAVAESVRAVCKIGGCVEIVSPGSLANDGKVIDDRRELT